MSQPRKSVCVYCGSRLGKSPAYSEAARATGRMLARNGWRLVYGAGDVGLMGEVARAAIEAGGATFGVIPLHLMAREVGRRDLSTLVVTEDMHERKHRMFEESDAFVALPGGIGTVEEIVEIMTWAQLGRHRKPIVYGNIDGFWNPMLKLIDHMRAEGFVHTAHLVQPLVVDTAEGIVPAILEAAEPGRAGGDSAVIERL